MTNRPLVTLHPLSGLPEWRSMSGSRAGQTSFALLGRAHLSSAVPAAWTMGAFCADDVRNDDRIAAVMTSGYEVRHV